MKVYVNSIQGIADAIIAMHMSKRTWTPEFNEQVYHDCNLVLGRDGRFTMSKDGMESYVAVAPKEIAEEYRTAYNNVSTWISILFKWGKIHNTLLRFIDFSCTVEGLHRGAQDDFDSHAKRLENRIVRSSTRLAKFGQEKSDYYANKILTYDEILPILDLTLPETIVHNGVNYIKTVNGYVDEQYTGNNDVLRGLYMLSIPSNFIFKCNLTEWSHIVKERDNKSNAAPELKEMIENICENLESSFPTLNKDYWYSIKN